MEQNLGFQGDGAFGFETLTLGQPGSNLPVLKNEITAGIASTDFYIASWGIRPLATNLSTFDNPIPSWISNLKASGAIASLSWGYTAGSHSQYLSKRFLVRCQSFPSL